jgi:hypothetical protein
MPVTEQSTFIDSLMSQIMDGANIPKYQVERAVSPILGVFIEPLMSAALNADVVMLAPEFPIRKEGSGDRDGISQRTTPNTSTNIDWLMFNKTHNELVLLELKTTDTTFSLDQVAIYARLKKDIEEHSAAFLLDDLESIRRSSSERGKYDHVQNKLLTALGDAASVFGHCRSAKIVYLAPEVSKPSEFDLWLTFSKLPEEIATPHPEEWSAVRGCLSTLDNLSRKQRNQQPDTVDRKNFNKKSNINDIKSLCQTHGNGIIIGFSGGLKALRAEDMNTLEQRQYKWDYTSTGTGMKDLKNWISGEDFLSAVMTRSDR